jgi:hypothetical protein
MANRRVGYIEARRTVEGWTQSWSLIGKGNSKINNIGGQNRIWVRGEKKFSPLRKTRKTKWDRPKSLQPNQDKGHSTGLESARQRWSQITTQSHDNRIQTSTNDRSKH